VDRARGRQDGPRDVWNEIAGLLNVQKCFHPTTKIDGLYYLLH